MSQEEQPLPPRADVSADTLVPVVRAARSTSAVVAYDAVEAPAEFGPRPTAGRFTWSALWRYRWTFVVLVVLLGVPASVVTWRLVIPEYRAGAVVEVSPVVPRLVFKTEDNGLIPLYRQYLNTQVAILRSAEVLNRVLDRADVQKTQWYREPAPVALGTPLPPLERLAQALSVGPRRDTQVIDVKVAARRAGEAALLANAVVDAYLRVVGESLQQTDRFLGEALDKEYKSLRGEIEGREATVSQLRKTLGTGDPEQLLSARRARLEDLEAQRQSMRREAALTLWQLERAQAAAQPPGPDESADSSPTAARPNPPPFDIDPEWRRLSLAAEQARHLVELKQSRLGEANPEMVELRANAELAERLVRQREAQLEQRWAAVASGTLSPDGAMAASVDPREALSAQLEKLRYQETLLTRDIEAAGEEVRHTAEVVQTLTKENDTLRHKRDAYEAVRTRIMQRDLERQVPIAIRRQSDAIAPSQPYNAGRRVMLTALAAAAAAGVAAGVCYLRALRDPAVRGAADVPGSVEAPFLGYLALLRDTRRATPHEEAVQVELMRMVRTALLERLAGVRGAAVVVTSAGAQAGKTTVAVLLAKSLAQCGQRVLLVDADLRNPSVAVRVGIQSEPGLVGVLTRTVRDEDALRSNGVPGLHVLPAGSRTAEQDSELLANGIFSASLKRWRERFDFVVLDAPPILSVADARILARQVDGTVMVVREGHCQRPDVMEAMAAVGVSGGRLLGTVYVGSRPRGGNYYYGVYGTSGPAAALDVRESSSPSA